MVKYLLTSNFSIKKIKSSAKYLPMKYACIIDNIYIYIDTHTLWISPSFLKKESIYLMITCFISFYFKLDFCFFIKIFSIDRIICPEEWRPQFCLVSSRFECPIVSHLYPFIILERRCIIKYIWVGKVRILVQIKSDREM
jgi:hypothetical protein